MADELTPRSGENGLEKANEANAPITNNEPGSFFKQLLGFG